MMQKTFSRQSFWITSFTGTLLHCRIAGEKTMRLLTTLLLLAHTVPPIIAWSLTSPWHNPSMPDRDDLNCDDWCLTNMREDLLAAGIDPRDDCCICHSGSTWHNNVQQLYVETVSLTGTNLLLNQSTFDNDTFYHIEYSYKQLREFPSNLCTSNRMTNCFTSQFSHIQPFLDNIVKIDFSDNVITDLVYLNCLTRLDILDLRNNHIAVVSNTSFNNLSYLRELYLQNNFIKHMDAAVVSGPKLNIVIVNISHNLLEELDVTNMISQKPFCLRVFDNNNVTNLVNELDFKLTIIGNNTGAGFVSLQDNNLQTFPDFKELLNLDSLQEMGKLISFGFDLRGIPLECDCNLAPFMGLAENEIESLWQDYFNISCTAPDEMVDVTVHDFINNTEYLDRLVCDVSDDPDCPDKCSCVDQPSQNRLLINCSGRGLYKLPETLPDSKFSNKVNIDLSNNNITTLTNVSYLRNITHISLANNNLQRITSAAAYLLSNVSIIDLGNNPHLKTLPSELQYRKNSTIILTNNTLDCDCDSTWIQNWTQNSRSSFLCRVPGHGVMPPGNFSQDLLDCDPTVNKLIVLSILLGIAALTLIIAGVVSYWLRYEIYILMVRAKQVNKNAILPMFHYDAYLSFDEENDDLRVWAHKILVHQLEKMGYKLFVPLRDLQFGDVRQLNTIGILQKTKNFLLILSESYTTQDHDNNWQHQEWQYGWNMFKASRMKNIVMINYDQILASEVPHPQIKAFLRVGNPVDFTNTKRDILQQICQRLGPPNRWHSKPKLAGRNRKAVLQVDQLFLTHTARQEQDKQRQELNKQRRELEKKRQDLDKQRQDLDDHRQIQDKVDLNQAVLVAKEEEINIECIENQENVNDQNTGGEDLELQKQELDKQRKELDKQMAEIDNQLDLNEDDHINQVFAGNIGDGNEGFKRGQHLEMTVMGRTAKDTVANNRFRKALGNDVKKQLDRKVSDDSGIVLDEECDRKSQSQVDVSIGNIMVTERPRPAQGPYKYYV